MGSDQSHGLIIAHSLIPFCTLLMQVTSSLKPNEKETNGGPQGFVLRRSIEFGKTKFLHPVSSTIGQINCSQGLEMIPAAAGKITLVWTLVKSKYKANVVTKRENIVSVWANKRLLLPCQRIMVPN